MRNRGRTSEAQRREAAVCRAAEALAHASACTQNNKESWRMRLQAHRTERDCPNQKDDHQMAGGVWAAMQQMRFAETSPLRKSERQG